MEQKIEMTAREREILSIVNDRLNLGVTTKSQETVSGIHDILALAWDTPKEILHDLGIGRYKIALMYYRLLGIRGFLSECQATVRKEPFFFYNFC